MKKIYRLIKNWDFNHVIQNGKLLKSRNFLIYYQHRNNFYPIRVGISVPKRHFHRAFLRNKIKRQINNMINDIVKKWAVDVIIIIKKNYDIKDYAENKNQLRKILIKIPLKGENNGNIL